MKNKIWRTGTLSYTAGGLVVLFLWLMWGDFAYSMKDRAATAVAGLMLKSFNVSDFVYGLIIISIPNITNIILCPIVSYRSDRHRGKYGRRIPYLAMTIPLSMTGLIGLGFTPMLARHIAPMCGCSYQIIALLLFCVFWILHDMGISLANALFNALATDVVPGEFLGRFFAMFRAVSLGSGFLFNFYVMGYAETQAFIILVSLGILYGIGLLSLCLKVKEGDYPPFDDESEDPPTASGAIKTYFRECFALPYYRWVIAAWVLSGFSTIPFNIYTMFYAKSLNMDMDQVGKINAAICLISFLLSFFLGWFSDRFHPIRTGMVAIAIQTAILFVGGQIATTVGIFKWIFLFQGISIMAFNTLVASYAPRLFPKEYFAQFNSAMLLITALGSMIGAPLVGRFLDLTHNYYPHLFTIGGLFGVAGLLCFCMVYRGFKRHGGDACYQAPDPAPKANTLNHMHLPQS